MEWNNIDFDKAAEVLYDSGDQKREGEERERVEDELGSSFIRKNVITGTKNPSIQGSGEDL